MTQPVEWPKIAVVGAGAVGGYFGGMLARAGAPVVMIGRAAFVEAVNQNGLLLDTLHFKESVRVEASAELDVARGAEVVLFCVKTTDTAETARALAPLSRLLPLTARLLAQDGFCLFLKGIKVEEELTEVAGDWAMTVDRIGSQTSPEGVVLRLSGLRKKDSNP